MKKWNIPQESADLRYPNEILQDYANELVVQTNGILTGQVTEQISYDSNDRPILFFALHVYVAKLNQSYRLFEIEQLTEKPYPVNLKAILYTGSEVRPNLQTPTELSAQLDVFVESKLVGNLLAHFIRLSGLKA